VRRAVLLGSLAVLLLAGSVGAGSYVPPPGDCCPQWSPNGTQIVFTTNRTNGGGQAVGVVGSAGAAEKIIPDIPIGLRSPDWSKVATTKAKNGAQWLAVSSTDGSGEKLVAQLGNSLGFTWSPDSKRVAYVASDDSLHVIGVDGSQDAQIAPRATQMPSWSPNGLRVAYASAGAGATRIHVVGADGSGDLDLTSGNEPSWSPDSKQLSFLRGSRIGVVRIGGATRTYQLAKPALLNDGWFPDGKALLYDAEPVLPPSIDNAEIGTIVNGRIFQGELVRLEVATGKRRILSFGHGAEFSRNGQRLSFSSGGECRDREGMYVMRVNGSGLRRLTNDCSIRGTANADTLHGTELADALLGLGGNDRLLANDPGYVGDTLDGGPGNDVLVGAFRQDTLDGGPGDDTLDGGASADTLIGGSGRDQLNGQGGRDTIYSRDGQRDVVTCGANAFGPRGRDTVYADRFDLVAADCEMVHRG
jgi:Tol biopolymer transport system component